VPAAWNGGLKTEWTEAQIRELVRESEGSRRRCGRHLLVELLAKPIMEWLVPRAEGRVFGELAGRIIDRTGSTMEETHPKFRQAWNRVDARLARSSTTASSSQYRQERHPGCHPAPGWTGGTIARSAGPQGLADFSRNGGHEEGPGELPDRVAYVLAS